jgi:hypothetical protein
MPETKRESKGGHERKPMSWLQLMNEFRYTFEASMGEPVPGDFWHHVHTARKESLLALRSLIDVGIEHIEEKEARSTERTATKIAIQ